MDDKANNIIISGLKRAESERISKTVNEALEAVGLSSDKVDRTSWLETKTKVDLVLVEFKKEHYKTKAHKLRHSSKITGIYINADRTRNERINDKRIRDEAKERNSKFSETDENGRPFGREGGKAFYWAPGDSQPRKVFLDAKRPTRTRPAAASKTATNVSEEKWNMNRQRKTNND